MQIQDAIGELLYIGIVAEKGRCFGKKWSLRYRKILKCHIKILSELLDSMIKNHTEVDSTIAKFVEICDNNVEIGKFYKISDDVKNQLYEKSIKWERGKCNYYKVDKLMQLIMKDLLGEVNKFIIKKQNIYYLLNVLHNLPRVYLGERKNSICELSQTGISEEDALLYTFQIMNGNDRKRFDDLLN